MPVTLALDTATPFLTLALAWDDGEVQRSLEVGRAHAERLSGEVRALFSEAGLPFQAHTIVIGTGPGSYTGVRVGASYALGLGRVWQAKVLGVSTLEGLVSGSGRQAVSQDARKGNLYCAIYDVAEGVVQGTVLEVAKREREAFLAQVAGLPHYEGTAPGGLNLLKAGLAHGQDDWQLAYL